MTREEIIKIFEENHIAKGIATINATKLAEICTKHETDLLKEFVEWYKEHLNGIVKYEKDLYTDAKNNKHEDNATFFLGEINMLERLLSWIDIKLERFLEERKK